MALNTRQRMILYFLSRRSSSTGRTELMKWLFLYGQSNVSLVSRYDFVPYKYGPFSFEVYQDLMYSLSRFVSAFDSADRTDQTIRLRMGNEREIQSNIDKIPAHDRNIAERVWTTYNRLKRPELLQLVYKQHPWYASRSELIPCTPHPVAKIQIYTSGYEGRSIDAFFNCLLVNGIQGILDVRRNAYSQKFGFSGSTLRNTGRKVEIKYDHLPDLGIASELRRDLQSPDALERLFHQYEQDIEVQQEAIQSAIQIIISRPTALLCFEAEPHMCHRGRLAPKLAHLTNLEVRHL